MILLSVKTNSIVVAFELTNFILLKRGEDDSADFIFFIYSSESIGG